MLLLVLNKPIIPCIMFVKTSQNIFSFFLTIFKISPLNNHN
nr:MAG TPA: hypothetical protein [Caudoviricetes sp.]